MNVKSSLIGLLCCLFFYQCQKVETYEVKYPETRQVVHSDIYFDTVIRDPYQWLEDDQASETKAWVFQQNEATNAYLDQIPFREKVRQRFKTLYDYPKVKSPVKAGEHLFFYKKEGLQDQYVIYKQKGIKGKPVAFLDANTASEDGTVTYALSSFSKDNKTVAVRISVSGSDWAEIGLMDVETGTWLKDRLKWLKFGGVYWYEDGFFYSRFPAPDKGDELKALNSHMKVYYHKLGTDQEADQLVYEDKENPNIYSYSWVTEDDAYLVLYKSKGTHGNEIYIDDLNQPGWNFVPVTTGFAYNYSMIGHFNDQLYMKTDQNAPNYRVVRFDPAHPGSDNWEDVIPDGPLKIEKTSTAGNKLFVHYLDKASTKVKVYDLDGQFEKEIELPGICTAGGFAGKMGDDMVFYNYSSYTMPSVINIYDIANGTSEAFFVPELKYDPDQFETNQVTYKSKDGTDITMFLVHKKGIKKNGENLCYLYGYGGFNISETPEFKSHRIMLLENDGIIAVANLRGGGEYGDAWHKAGMLMNKQTVFDDFVAAAEYLVTENYTRKEKLAMSGRSNGGLLIGAIMTQRPDICQVAFPEVGVMDMLKYHQFTVGKGWVPEYGSSEQSKEMFEYLLGYSPYHNIDTVAYPATMVGTADHDDRVVPAHSFKFAARLQEMHKGELPVLIRIDKSAGHGSGKPTSKIIDQWTDHWSFMFYNTGLKDVYLPKK